MTLIKSLVSSLVSPLVSDLIFSEGFNPTQLSGNKLWLDASTIETDGSIIDGSNRISLWADKSPYDKDAEQATSANQPLYDPVDQSVFMDSGTAKSMLIGSSGDFDFLTDGTAGVELFLVINQQEVTPPTAFQDIFDCSTNSGNRYSILHSLNSANQIRAVLASSSSVEINSDTPSSFTNPGNITNINIRHSSASSPNFTITNQTSTTAVNYAVGTPVSTSLPAISIAGTDLLMRFHEIILYDRVLSDSERTQINNYLSDKWT